MIEGNISYNDPISTCGKFAIFAYAKEQCAGSMQLQLPLPLADPLIM
jgi:hypothetical protein